MVNEVLEGHIVKRFDNDLERLEQRVRRMGDFVREQLERIPLAIREEDAEVAKVVVERDGKINSMELKTDKLIIRLLARRAPVGRDLRFIIAVSRIVTDLEQIGDEAAAMAKTLVGRPDGSSFCDGSEAPDEVSALTRLAAEQLDKAIAAFEGLDEVSAREVAFGGTAPQGELLTRVKALAECARGTGIDVNEAVDLVLVTRALERIASGIRNIGEHTIYLVTGEDVRHLQNKQ